MEKLLIQPDLVLAGLRDLKKEVKKNLMRLLNSLSRSWIKFEREKKLFQAYLIGFDEELIAKQRSLLEE